MTEASPRLSHSQCAARSEYCAYYVSVGVGSGLGLGRMCAVRVLCAVRCACVCVRCVLGNGAEAGCALWGNTRHQPRPTVRIRRSITSAQHGRWHHTTRTGPEAWEPRERRDVAGAEVANGLAISRDVCPAGEGETVIRDGAVLVRAWIGVACAR